jgi:diguanylate cyclase (GGDEF)-like protein/PAS domain S-box-containing protein
MGSSASEHNVDNAAYLLVVAANAIDRAVLIIDDTGTIVFCNDVFLDMFGYGRDDVLGAAPLSILQREDIAPTVVERIREDLRRGLTFEEETIAHTRGGQKLFLSVTLTARTDPRTGKTYTVLVLSNITESKQIQALQRDVLEAIARDASLPQVMHLLCERVDAMAPDAICSTLLVDREQRLRPLAAPALPPQYSAGIDGVLVGPKVGSCGTAAWRGEPVMVTDIGADPLWADFRDLALGFGLRACWSSPIALRDGRVAGTFAFYYRTERGPSSWHQHIVDACVHLCVVAIERHEAKAHIDRLAYFDTLTGLPNRAHLTDSLGTMIGSGDTKRPVAVAFLDLDHFKDVNDTLGHAVGDALLVETAQRLRALVRPGDVISRLGGDEFVLVLDGCDGPAASLMVQQIMDGLSQPATVDGVTLPVSASMGISLCPGDGDSVDVLLKTADSAMYQAKAAGRGTWRFFSRDMNSMAQDRLLLGAALRDAIANDLLDLHYQPQVDTATGVLTGVEALARWTHPVFGSISPGRFIALAEESGLIEKLGEWGIDKACEQLARWRRRGYDVPSISVNISPLHFRNRDLLECVRGALERHRIAPDMLTVEITERVILDDCPTALRNADALHALGVRLSMDDFGTGYSSLSHLAKIPAREIKIDRSFMSDLETSENRRAIVTAVVRIGQSLKMRVVAEGVETAAQRHFLEVVGCQAMQGFLIARPMPAEAFEDWHDASWPTLARAVGAA